jgi:hypothetical protein
MTPEAARTTGINWGMPNATIDVEMERNLEWTA